MVRLNSQYYVATQKLKLGFLFDSTIGFLSFSVLGLFCQGYSK